MRFRTGLLIGLAVGYYFGTKAGRERYEQIQEGLANLVDGALGRKVRAGIELGLERVRTASTPPTEVDIVVIDEASGQ